MTDARIGMVATTATLLLLLFASGSASAHKAHVKTAQEAVKTTSPEEVQVPVSPAPDENSNVNQHHHAEPDAHQPAEQPLLKTEPVRRTEHDHSSHGEPAIQLEVMQQSQPDTPTSNVPKLLAWLGKFHPPLTHFPIALLVAAALAEVLFMRTGKVEFDHAARFTAWLGAAAGLAAAPLGWFFAGFQLVDDEWVMTAHRWFGTATALWAGVLLITSAQLTRSGVTRGRFRWVLFVGAAFVSITGFLGGSLLYGIDHYAW